MLGPAVVEGLDDGAVVALEAVDLAPGDAPAAPVALQPVDGAGEARRACRGCSARASPPTYCRAAAAVARPAPRAPRPRSWPGWSRSDSADQRPSQSRSRPTGPSQTARAADRLRGSAVQASAKPGNHVSRRRAARDCRRSGAGPPGSARAARSSRVDGMVAARIGAGHVHVAREIGRARAVGAGGAPGRVIGIVEPVGARDRGPAAAPSSGVRPRQSVAGSEPSTGSR